MNYAPFARIFLRYVVGALIGSDIGDILSADPDIVTYVALAIGAVVEIAYGFAKRRGWAT